MSEIVFEDGFNLLCGKQLGSGISRKVFECRLDPTLVVKVQHDDTKPPLENMMEFEVWQSAMMTEFAKWFAPCTLISTTGRILLQKRTFPTRDLPLKVPAFFTDLKPENWGLLDGKPVCHDYALNQIMEVGLRKKMRKVNWEY